MDKTKRVSNCCFNTLCETWRNLSDKDFLDYLVKSNFFCYIIFQREYSERKGEHWQGYLELKRQRYLTQIIRLVKGFVEERKRSQEEAIDYCKKENTKIGPTYE